MPYRRMPNTDKSRIEALTTAIKMAGHREGDELVIYPEEVVQMSDLLKKIKKSYGLYQQYYDKYMEIRAGFDGEMKKAQMYLSHYIQVFNMCVERGELKKKFRVDFGLDENDDKLPPLRKASDIVKWGERIIKAEEKRLQKGGTMVYNPTLAKVKVYWSIFNDHYFSVDQLCQTYQKYLDELTAMRPETDEIILKIWNRVEALYADLPSQTRIEKAKKFGIRYYMRTSEKKKAQAEALQTKLF